MDQTASSNPEIISTFHPCGRPHPLQESPRVARIAQGRWWRPLHRIRAFLLHCPMKTAEHLNRFCNSLGVSNPVPGKRRRPGGSPGGLSRISRRLRPERREIFKRTEFDPISTAARVGMMSGNSVPRAGGGVASAVSAGVKPFCIWFLRIAATILLNRRIPPEVKYPVYLSPPDSG